MSIIEYPRLSYKEIITILGSRFRDTARDRRVYAVIGTYDQIESFSPKLKDLCEKGALCEAGENIAYFDLNNAIIEYLEKKGKLQQAKDLAERMRNKELARIFEQTWPLWLSENISKCRGLVLSGFELFFSYLDANALALVRQYAINGKHICIILPATERQGHVWAFHETPEYEREITGLVSEWTHILKDKA